MATNNRRAKRRRVNKVVVTTSTPVLNNNNTNNPSGRRRRRSRRQRPSKALALLSQPGLAFLKCAFAPPDFNTDPGKGIPDRFEGKVVTRKDVLSHPISFEAGKDTYILITPTPGVACWIGVTDNGKPLDAAVTFHAVGYPGFESMFGETSNDRGKQVSAFRYASLNAGVYPTSNMTQFAGSITVWKCPVRLSTSQATMNTEQGGQQLKYVLLGLDGVLAVGPDNYAESFIKGVFSQSVCNEPEFEFSNIIDGVQVLPPNDVTTGQPFTLSSGPPKKAGIVGWGNMDTIVIKVSTPAGAVNAAILKAWACLEYRPNPNAALYQFGHDSPPLDEIALREYRTIARSLPVAVTASQNASMWERVKAILKATLGFAATLPGPIGMAATGISGIASLIENFTL